MIRLHRGSLLFLASFLTASLLCAVMPAAAGDTAGFERARILRVLDLLQPQRGIPAGPVAVAKRAVAAQEGGTITGTVRGLDREGFESAHVVAWQADSISGEDGTAIDGAVTDGAVAIGRAKVEPDGSYRLSGLAPGQYYVSGVAKGYETRYYEDAFDLGSATTVEVIEGEASEGVDFDIQRDNVGTGSIAGVVISDVDGQPVAGAIVHAFGAQNPFSYGVAETDAAGAYTLRGLRSGTYIVEAMSPNFLPEFYGDVTAFDEAVLVVVVEPEQTDGIAFSLAVGGAITGVVRNGDGGPVVGAYVSATQPGRFDVEVEEDRVDGRLLPVAPGGWAVTDENGAYRLGGLVTGAYRVQAQFSTRWQFVSIWFDDATTWDQAADVAVTTGETVSAIDMTLELPVLASGVAGRVTDSNGHPVAGAFVTLQAMGDESMMDSVSSNASRPGDTIFSDSGSSSSGSATAATVPVDESLMVSSIWAHATTDADGRYMIDELPAGSYILSAASENGWERVHRWYVDADTPRNATRLSLAEGERLTQIDMILPVRTATASVSGVVQDQDGQLLARAFVQISTPESTRSDAGDGAARLWAYAQTDDQGVYRVDRLPAGTYIVHASYHTGDRFGQRWFDGADTPRQATPLLLADDESRTGVDLQLTVRPLYGEVRGVVTDAQTGTGIARAYVELTPAQRDAPRDMPVNYGVSTAVTDEIGSFRMPWTPEGIYTMTVYANGGMAHYVHPDTDALSTAIHVVGGETTQNDVALAFRQDGEGAITGSVTLGHGGPIFGPEEPAIDLGIAEGDDIADADIDDTGDVSRTSLQATPEIAVVIAYPASRPGMRYVAVTGTDGMYALRGLPADDFVVMCFAPGHIGTYYDGEYAPDKARPITVEAAGQVDGINFELAGLYRIYTIAEDAAVDGSVRAPGDDAASEGVAVFGQVIDDEGQPVVDATVFLLDTQEQPVAFAQTGSDGNFELPTVSPGEYRVYASRLGFTGSYNGNRRDFAMAEPLGLAGGEAEVKLVLTAGLITAVEENSSDATPTVMALQRNYPNPFNPETTIRFSVPTAGPAVLRIHNALGQRLATLHNDAVEAGRPYDVVFQAKDLGSGVYYYVLEFQGERLTRSMLLMK